MGAERAVGVKLGFTEMKKKFERVAQHRHRLEVFYDWLACAAISFSNAVDFVHKDRREKEYMRIVKQYSKEDLEIFAQMISDLVFIYETNRDQDVLGDMFMQFEIANKDVGQFFTPYHISKLMCQMAVPEPVVRRAIQDEGFVTMLEPACGAGGMCIAFSNIMDDFDCHSLYHVTAIDISITCVHMTYIQLTLLDIAAVIYHGNSLACEMWSRWRTPKHILEFWDTKLKRKHTPIEVKRTKDSFVESNTSDAILAPNFERKSKTQLKLWEN